MSDFFINRDGKIHGPFNKSQLQKGLSAKKIRSSDLISKSKSGPWKTLSESLGKSASPVAVESSAIFAEAPEMIPETDEAWDDVIPVKPSRPQARSLRKNDAKVLSSYLSGSTNTEEKVGLLNLRLHEIEKTEDEWWDAAPDSAGEDAAERKMGMLRSKQGRFKGLFVNNSEEEIGKRGNTDFSKIAWWASVAIIGMLVFGVVLYTSVKIYRFATTPTLGSPDPRLTKEQIREERENAAKRAAAREIIRNTMSEAGDAFTDAIAEAAANRRGSEVRTIGDTSSQSNTKQYPKSLYTDQEAAKEAFKVAMPGYRITAVTDKGSYWEVRYQR